MDQIANWTTLSTSPSDDVSSVAKLALARWVEKHVLRTSSNAGSTSTLLFPEDFTGSVQLAPDWSMNASTTTDYGTVSPSTDQEDPSLPAWWLQMCWASAFCVLVAVAVLGNAIVVWAVLGHSVMRTATNYLLVNVSVANLMMATFNAMFNCAVMLRSDWPFGDAYCTFNSFVNNLSVAGSVFSLMAISMDRYTAIVNPLQPRLSRRRAVLAVGAIWLTAALLALPNLLYAVTQSFPYYGSLRTLCYLHWPDGPSWSSQCDYIYNIVFLMATYVLPMLSMSVAYARMGRELWGSQTIGECGERQVVCIKSKRRVVRMFMALVGIFGACWLPYQVYFLYIPYNKDLANTVYIRHVYLAIYWLAMSNAVYDPIIYFTMNDRFRRYLWTALSCGRISSAAASPKSFSGTAGGGAISDRHNNASTRQMSQKKSLLKGTSSNGTTVPSIGGSSIRASRASMKLSSVFRCLQRSKRQVDDL